MSENALIQIEKIATETQLAKLECLPQLQRMVALASGMRELRKLISGDVLDAICELKNSQIGFGTDEATRGREYTKQEIKEVAIEALLRGAQLVGNEINVIKGKCYRAKAYYERMCRETVSELRVTEGVPVMGNGGALVPMWATWSYRGHSDSIACEKTETKDTRIPVKVNKEMGTDAILGKAYCKLYARIFRRATGSEWMETDADEADNGDVIDVMVTPASEPAARQIDWDAVWQQLCTVESEAEMPACIRQIMDEWPGMCEADEFKLNDWAERRIEAIKGGGK